MLLAALAFGWKYGSALPWGEDWVLIVPVMTGEQPVTASWLWLGEGEHRIPLPKLVWVALLRLGDYDFRAGMCFNVFTLGLLAFSMILAARALRGWTSYADAFFPVALLHWGQWPNLLLLMQVHQVLPIFLAGMLLVLIARSRTPLPGGTALLAGICLILLPLCGSVGLAHVPALSLWLGYSGVLAWRSSQPHGRRNCLLMLAFALAGLALLRLYFVGWKPNDPIGERTLWATLTTSTQFLSLSFGPASRALWPYSGLGVLGLALFGVAALVLVWRRQPQERFRAVGLLLFMGASACLALAVGWGRNEGVADQRYVTFGVPMLCGVYFIWVVHGGPSGRLAQMCLFTLICAVFALNTLDGLENGRRLCQLNAALEQDLVTGTPASVLAQRHCKEEGPIWCVSEEQAASMMRRMRQRGIGLFRYLPSVEGALDAGDGDQISGWAWDMDQPATPVRVDIYADETLLATVAADQARDGLREAGVGDGRHGFSLPTPEDLRDGKAHAVRVEVAGTGHSLGEFALLAPTAGPPPPDDGIGGALDVADGGAIAGWAWDGSRPDSPLKVDIYDDDTRLATVVADEFRQDLLDAGMGGGKHAFSLATPEALKDGRAHAIRVKVAGTDRTVAERGLLARGGPGPARKEDEAYQQLVDRIRQVVRAKLPADATVLVVSKGDDNLLKLDGRKGWHFPRDEHGNYDGNPADSKEAIARLEAQQAKGAQYLLFPEPAFWWLDEKEGYKGFKQHLDGRYRRVHGDASCVIYELSPPG
jgi:hypothetical protein